MKLIHVITRNTDWDKMTYDKFLKQDVGHFAHTSYDNHPKKMIRFVKTWDQMFDISFFRFRSLLTKIAQRSFLEVGFDETIELADLHDYAINCDDNFYFAISDDDDWYSPDLRQILKYEDDVVSWSDWRIDFDGIKRKYNVKWFQLPANGFVVSKLTYVRSPAEWKFIRKRSGAGLAPHGIATYTLARGVEADTLTHQYLPDLCYSMGCKTIASFQSFGPCLVGNIERNSARYILEKRNTYVPFQNEASPETYWSQKFIAMLVQLHFELFSSLKITEDDLLLPLL